MRHYNPLRMPPTPELNLTLTAADLADIDTDLLFVPVFDAESLDDLPGLAAGSDGQISRALASREFQGRPYELFLTPLTGWRTPRVALIGAGPRAQFNTERLRRLATAAAVAARHRRVTRMGWLVRGDIPSAAAVQASAEGLGLSAFSIDRYKSGERGGPPLEEMTIAIPGAVADQLRGDLERGRILAESCNVARELCNEPPNVLTPTELGHRAAAMAREVGLGVEVLDEKALAGLGMGLLLGVGQGSAQPPRMIVLTHTPRGQANDAGHVLGLVGKGVTFDTGGISIKPAEGMDRMKTDMSGAAAVLGALRAISLLDAPMPVIGVIPSAENMPGGRAIRPSDVLTGASGTTVEVVNTDAEGRLILGDALWYARELGATHLVDVATLTGAIVIALGKVASGLFGQPDPWVEVIRRTSEAAGDRCWPMPLYDEYAEQLKSEIADMINSGGRPAGACTAAMFLKEFAGGLPWAHIDIAGTAWAEDAKPWQPKGPTGAAVRTLAGLAFTSQDWK
ncbi:leucyl aminopeptidase [soil metagenome]